MVEHSTPFREPKFSKELHYGGTFTTIQRTQIQQRIPLWWNIRHHSGNPTSAWNSTIVEHSPPFREPKFSKEFHYGGTFTTIQGTQIQHGTPLWWNIHHHSGNPNSAKNSTIIKLRTTILTISFLIIAAPLFKGKTCFGEYRGLKITGVLFVQVYHRKRKMVRKSLGFSLE
jgi:hypothetical protein